jgi:hypothetical protein
MLENQSPSPTHSPTPLAHALVRNQHAVRNTPSSAAIAHQQSSKQNFNYDHSHLKRVCLCVYALATTTIHRNETLNPSCMQVSRNGWKACTDRYVPWPRLLSPSSLSLSFSFFMAPLSHHAPPSFDIHWLEVFTSPAKQAHELLKMMRDADSSSTRV